MALTTFSGPLKTGDVKEGALANLGYVKLQQDAPLVRDATLVQNATFYLPQGAQIVDVILDVTAAYDSATSATFSLGTSTGDTSYVSGVNAKTTGRTRPTFTTTQLTNMQNIGTNTTVVATITSVGQPTVGTTLVQLIYVQQ